MNESKEDKKLVPPYVSYKTFLNFLEKLKIGMPSRIDRTVMGSFSGAAQAQLLTTLKYLHLIKSDDIPDEKLTQLVTSEGMDRQKILKDIITASYSFLFKDGVDLKKITLGHLEDLFDKAGSSGGTTRKCIAFFMAAAKNAGIELSPHLKKIRGMGRNAGRMKKVGEKTERQYINSHLEEIVHREETWQQILASKFPSFDPSWSAEVQGKWFDAFNKLMDQFKKTMDEEKEAKS